MFFEFTKASMSNTGIQATYMSENVCWPAGPLWGTKRQNVLQDFPFDWSVNAGRRLVSEWNVAETNRLTLSFLFKKEINFGRTDIMAIFANVPRSA